MIIIYNTKILSRLIDEEKIITSIQIDEKYIENQEKLDLKSFSKNTINQWWTGRDLNPWPLRCQRSDHSGLK